MEEAHSSSDSEIFSPKWVDEELCEVPQLCREGHDDELKSEIAASGSYAGIWHMAVVWPKPKQPHDELPLETLSWGLRARIWLQPWLNRVDVVQSKPEKPQNELPHEIIYPAIKATEQKQDERPHENQRAWRPLCVSDDIGWPRHAVKPTKAEQDARPNQPSIRPARDFVTEFDRTNQTYETTTIQRQKDVPVLLSGHFHLYVSASHTTGTSGMGKTAIDSYVCFPNKHYSESNKNYSELTPISGNRKDEDLQRGNRKEDKDPNGGTTVITIRDEDEKRDCSYNSSFASAQLLTLAISSLLLCFIVLFPDFTKKYQAITAAALMTATLGSLVSLEAIPQRPNLARSCGYLAMLSLLVALASILSVSVNWVTI